MGFWGIVEVILISLVSFLVALFITFKLTKSVKKEYECSSCKEKFKPSVIKEFFALHSDDTRKLKCPNCGQKTWCKEVKEEEEKPEQ